MFNGPKAGGPCRVMGAKSGATWICWDYIGYAWRLSHIEMARVLRLRAAIIFCHAR